MPSAVAEYEKLVAALAGTDGITAGQLFGKACLKTGGKAFVAQHKETVVFKLADPQHAKAIGLVGAGLWDPSGKGRPMKEWVALPATESRQFKALAAAALAYASGTAR